jgi:putative ABC transport system permease protein
MVLSVAPQTIPRLHEAFINGPVLLFTAFVCLAVGVLVGLFPAFQVSRIDLQSLLRATGRGPGTGANAWSRKFLVVAEVGLSVVLVTSAGLFLRSYNHLQNVDRGFQSERLLTLQISLGAKRYRDAPERQAFYTNLLDAVANTPGVSRAAADTNMPLDGQRAVGMQFTAEGQPEVPAALRPAATCHMVNPDFFAGMGIPLIRGRAFLDRDRDGAPDVVIVSESLARRFWPSGNAVGMHIIMATPQSKERSREVVGVVRDIRYPTRKPDDSVEIYVPYLQRNWPNLFLMVRTRQDPRVVIGSVRAAIRNIDPELAVSHVEPMTDRLDALNARSRFSSFLLTIFALAAMLLAGVGIYGVVSYTTIERTQEFGVRLALGAGPGRVMRMVLRDGMVLNLVGLGAGLLAYLGVMQMIKGFIYGITPLDAISCAGAALLLTAISFCASYFPARRATRVDPAIALRTE